MHKREKKVSVLGLGYIGLPTASLLASVGYDVTGMDVSAHVVETINNGEVHIVEPDLDAYVRSAAVNGKLKAYTTVQPADIYMICVPTPFLEGEGVPQPDVTYVESAARSIAPHIKDGDIVILESTSPVGTTELICDVLSLSGVDTSSVYVAYCPERVLPGRIMQELVENDRVIGGVNHESTRVVAEFYQTFVKGDILETEAKTAEMCKLTENSFRDVNIAFANELSLICANNGVDVWNLIDLANHHPRVNILQPGAGVGGHCIAVDPWFIVSGDPSNARLIKCARDVNNYKPEWVLEKIKSECLVKGVNTVFCLGLSFKPDIDDLRESPAVEIVKQLIDDGFNVQCVEPNIDVHSEFSLSSLEKAFSGKWVVAILVKHQEFIDVNVREELFNIGALDFCGALT